MKEKYICYVCEIKRKGGIIDLNKGIVKLWGGDIITCRQWRLIMNENIKM